MIAIVTDSTAYLTHEEAVELGVVIVPMSYSFGKDMSLNEGCIENDEHAERQVAEGIDHVHTSQATLAGFFNAFQRLRRAGYEVLCITISSRLSGTYANAVLAARELGGSHIEVVDSLTTCSGLYLLIREARKRIRDGREALRRRQGTQGTAQARAHALFRGRHGPPAPQRALGQCAHVHLHGAEHQAHSRTARTGPSSPSRWRAAAWSRRAGCAPSARACRARSSSTASSPTRPPRALPCNWPATTREVERRRVGPVLGAHLGAGCLGVCYIER